MALHTPPIGDPSASLGGRVWHWRGGNMELGDGASPSGSGASFSLTDDLVTQLLLSRGVAREDLARHRAPSLRNFLPDPSIFHDMDKAAGRLADAIAASEVVTIYGDYDVDGATSAALMIRLLFE